MTTRDRKDELRRVSNRDLDARLVERLTAQARVPSAAAGYFVAFVMAAIAGCGVALVTGNAAASSGMMRSMLGPTLGLHGDSLRPLKGQVEVELSHASLPPAASVGQAVLPISFGEPVAPEDDVPPRQHRWHHHVRHNRQISYFLPAPFDSAPGSVPEIDQADATAPVARCEATP